MTRNAHEAHDRPEAKGACACTCAWACACSCTCTCTCTCACACACTCTCTCACACARMRVCQQAGRGMRGGQRGGQPRTRLRSERLSASKAWIACVAVVKPRPVESGPSSTASMAPRLARRWALGTPRWRWSRWRASCKGTVCRRAGGASQTTACTMAPSLKRRGEESSPQSAVHDLTEAVSVGEGPLSTRPIAAL